MFVASILVCIIGILMIVCSYFIGYYSGKLKYIKARIDTLSHAQDILKTNEHPVEWFEGVIWAIHDSNLKQKGE